MEILLIHGLRALSGPGSGLPTDSNRHHGSARHSPRLVALPTKGDIRAQDFDAAEKAGCSIGGGSTAVVSA
jgi:hypothetical protein